METWMCQVSTPSFEKGMGSKGWEKETQSQDTWVLPQLCESP